MPPIKVQFDVEPMGSVFYSGAESAYPGWYLRHAQKGQLVTTRLHYYDEYETEAAIMEAADVLGCVPDAILVQT